MNSLRDLLSEPLIRTQCRFSTKEELLELIADKAFSEGYVTSKEVFLEKLWEREKQMPTKIAKDIALPHARTDAVLRDFLFIVVSREGIPYGHLEEKVRIVFCIGARSDSKTYLNIVAKIARLLSKEDIRQKLIYADVPRDVIKTIRDFEDAEVISRDRKEITQYLAMVVINNSEHFDRAIQLSLERGLTNPTILDTTYGICALPFDIPFLGSIGLLADKRSASKIIIGVTADKDFPEKMAGSLHSEGIDLTQDGVGAILMIRLFDLIGGKDKQIDF